MKKLAIKAVSMTSLEIANLTEVRHDNVKRTIERLVEQGVINLPDKNETSFEDKMCRKRNVSVYTFTGENGMKDADFVIAKSQRGSTPEKGYFYIYDFGHIVKIGICCRNPMGRRKSHVHDLRKVGLPYKIVNEAEFHVEGYQQIENRMKAYFGDSATTEGGEWLKGVSYDDVLAAFYSFQKEI